MRLTLLLGGAPRNHRRVRAAEQAALAEAEAVARLWDEAPPGLDAIDEAAARLRARLVDLDRARAEVAWAASRSGGAEKQYSGGPGVSEFPDPGRHCAPPARPRGDL